MLGERSEEGEGEATGNLAWPKEEPGHTFGFPLNPAQLALQISFVLSAVLLWGQPPLVPLHWAPSPKDPTVPTVQDWISESVLGKVWETKGRNTANKISRQLSLVRGREQEAGVSGGNPQILLRAGTDVASASTDSWLPYPQG